MEQRCPQNIVSIRNINKSYRRGAQTVPVLEDITFEICDGEFLALMGPSGSARARCSTSSPASTRRTVHGDHRRR